MGAFTLLSVLPSGTSVILIALSLVLYVASYLRDKYTYWEKAGAPHVKPDSWLFGNFKDVVLRRSPVAYVVQSIYNELDGYKFGGFYQLTRPAIMIRDPELVKAVLVKDFNHFQDRTLAYCNEKVDPLSMHLLNLLGKSWKDVRSRLTPTFSSGKLRDMQDLMDGCISELADHLRDITSDGANGSDVQDLRELMSNFATDAIGACAFGLQCHTVRDGDSEFREIGRLIMARLNSSRLLIHDVLRKISPRLIDLFKLKLSHPEVERYFMAVLKQTVEYRRSNIQKRNNFLQLLINIQEEEKKLSNVRQQQNGTVTYDQNENIENSVGEQKDILFTDNVVASNAGLFFTAGFETTATTLSCCLYELALNQDICEKLKDEVELVKRAHDGNLNYDALRDLIYMDAVLSETLRKYPTAAVVTRRCTSSYQIPGTSVTIQKGTSVYIPVYSLHRDPKYFPEPDKFKPERFSEENKGTIVPGSYLPFGDGPKICIGIQFSRFEMKSCIAYVVSNYTIHPCEKTVVPLKFDPSSAGLHIPIGGVWVRFQRRSKS